MVQVVSAIDAPMRYERPQASAICGAKTRSGAPCKSKPMTNGRCRMHGGGAAGGILAPGGLPAGGRYSKYIPQRLLARYTEAAQDSELLALRDDIALIDSRLADLLNRVDSGESGRLWNDLGVAWDDVQDARAQGRTADLPAALNSLGHLIDRGQSDYGAWHEIHAVIEQRRKLVEGERKRLIDMQAMFTAEQGMTLIAIVSDSIRRNVVDNKVRAAINADIMRATGRP